MKISQKILLLGILAIATIACPKKEEEAPIDTVEGKALLLVAMDTAYNNCPGQAFTENTLSDAAGDTKIGMLKPKPTSFSYDDIISAKVTKDNALSRVVVDITLASIPSTIRYNKKELASQVGEAEYQWSVYFEKGGSKTGVYWTHRIKSTGEATGSWNTFLSQYSAGVSVDGKTYSCASFPTVSGNTISISCPYATHTNLATLDSSWTMRYYVVNLTSDGLVKDCL